MRDIITFGPDRPRRQPPRRPVVAGAVALVAAVVAVTAILAFGRHRAADPATKTPVSPRASVPYDAGGPPCRPVGWAQSPAVPNSAAGMSIGLASARPGSALDRCDRAATAGPWTVVVRRLDGSLGRHGAVVTFPVGPSTATRGVDVGGTPGKADSGTVTWPVAGGYARIRGDLDESELVGIAARTTVTDGRPAVDPPAGHVVVAVGPYRSPSVHQARYDSADLAEQATLGGGMTYTGVTGGGAFEDQLYAVHAQDSGRVDGRPAVLSSVSGGNATLAWEPASGVVAYIGYSGSELDDKAVAALHRLAAHVRLLTADQWQALNPQIVDQVNDPG